jgi:dTDP-4-dehydrorhamnose reductase
MRVVVTGGRGMLGSAVCAAFEAQGHRVLALGSRDADIRDYQSCRKAILSVDPDLIVHTAAMTDVDGCERDADSAFQINAIGSQNIAACCSEARAKMAYISTDFVFDGAKRSPYTEFDSPHPLNHYGESKLAGEQLARESCQETYVIRTSWLFGPNGKCFPKTILRLAKSKPSINVVADQIGCPTYVEDLADALTDIVASPRYGTYHVANSGETSWHGFAEAILKSNGITQVSVNPITAASWPSPTARPAYSVLRPYIRDLQGRQPLRDWRLALDDFVRRGIPD